MISIYFKITAYAEFSLHLPDELAYSFYCTFIRLICLTAKALRRITMHGFLVGATEPNKRTLNVPFFINNSGYKRVQLRILG